MNKNDFSIGMEFYTASGKWRCTDIGTRVIVAIPIDQVTATSSEKGKRKTTEVVTDDQSWFDGPSYAVAEIVFDTFDMGGCSLDPKTSSQFVIKSRNKQIP